MDLRVNGGSIVIQRDLGTPSAVSNLLALNNIVTGANLAVAVSATVLMRAPQRSIQLSLVTLLNSLRIGTSTPTSYKVGNSSVSRIYIGTNLVYQS